MFLGLRHPEATGVLLDDRVAQRQSQAGTILFRRKERIEDLRQLISGNAHPIIPNFQKNILAIHWGRANF